MSSGKNLGRSLFGWLSPSPSSSSYHFPASSCASLSRARTRSSFVLLAPRAQQRFGTAPPRCGRHNALISAAAPPRCSYAAAAFGAPQRNFSSSFAVAADAAKEGSEDDGGPANQVIVELLQKGKEWEERTDWKQALKAYTEAVDLVPSDPRAYLARADLLLRRKDYAAAKRDFQKATEMVPENLPSFASLARCEAALGNFQESLRITEHILFANPAYGDAHGLRGDVYQYMGNLDKATEEYKKVLQLNRHSVRGLLGLGRVEMLRHNFAFAKQCFSLAFNHSKKTLLDICKSAKVRQDREWVTDLIVKLLEFADVAAAASSVRMLAQELEYVDFSLCTCCIFVLPLSFVLLSLFAHLLYLLIYSDAISIIDDSLHFIETATTSLFSSEQHQNDSQRRITLYQAIGVDIAIADLHSKRAHCLLMLGRVEESLRDCRLALAMNEQLHSVHLTQGQAYMFQEKWREALHSLEAFQRFLSSRKKVREDKEEEQQRAGLQALINECKSHLPNN
ncbi:Serine/threonine-protein phosphatase 5 [Balamuthia mandrillaris]